MFPPSHSRTLDPNPKPYSERNKKKKGVENIDEKFTSKYGGAATIEWRVLGVSGIEVGIFLEGQRQSPGGGTVFRRLPAREVGVALKARGLQGDLSLEELVLLTRRWRLRPDTW
ncbi:hypothetical protein M6B38_257730 [Iris pallida]|uniref:Uncharacterized protein n=1 Tax=Iris pallida TaxID=29817 RepID=A0AAX6IHM5_IRIPA|nr:hypothetical protein M6B38_257730 [Iris pallida]